MSRAKDKSIVVESQKPIGFLKKIAIIAAIFITAFIVYPLLTKKDPDVVRVENLRREQFKKASEEELAPYRREIVRLEKKSEKGGILSEEELKRLDDMLEKTGEVKRNLKARYALPGERSSAFITQIYPNYDFPVGVDQIKVPLIPVGQQLSRQAGGWIITPAGSGYRIDYDVPVVIEYNDGRKFARQPKQPADDGVKPCNGIFRLYGKGGEATVTIKRGIY